MPNCIGIDFGSGLLKIAQCSKRGIARLCTETTPDNMVQEGCLLSPYAAADFLKESLKKNRISGKNCAILLPSALTIVRAVTMPLMKVEHIKLNLPFEFRDFITEPKDTYFYDYIITGANRDEDGKVSTMSLMAAAVAKKTVQDYMTLAQEAGLKLRIALTDVFALRNIFARAGVSGDDICVIDMGHSGTRVHITSGDSFMAPKVIDYGGIDLDRRIADKLNLDIHMASAYKMANTDNVQTLPECCEIYELIAVEAMRTINYYIFNNPNCHLNTIYLTGGCANIARLADTMREHAGMDVKRLEEIMPQPENGAELLTACAQAAGATMQ